MHGPEFFDEARRLMEAEEMPEKVSNKLLWAQTSICITNITVVSELLEKHDKRIQYLETLGKLIGLAIITLAIHAIFG